MIGERGATWLFFIAVAAGIAVSLLLPDAVGVTQHRAEEIAMLGVLPVSLFVVWALRKDHGPQQVDGEGAGSAPAGPGGGGRSQAS